MTKSLLKKGMWVPLVLLVALCVIVTAMAHGATFAYAEEESGLAFDKTDVIDDLKSATIDGKAFNINDYPYDEKGNIRLLTFIEYAYSFRQDQMDNYGLYAYLYNPSKETIDTSRCYITMYVDGDYHKFNLDYINQSTGTVDKLFYKFKVEDVEVNGTTFKDRVNPDYRSYAISEVEVVIGKSSYNPTKLGVSHEYVFTGYSQGYGADKTAESTLKSSSSSIETVELEVNHTTFRTNTSDKGKDHYNQLSTAWFVVPGEYFERYEYLSAITAMWYEYQTQYMFVTEYQAIYEDMYDLRYTTLSSHDYDDTKPSLYGGLTLSQSYSSGIGGLIGTYDWAYNLNREPTLLSYYLVDEFCLNIPWVLNPKDSELAVSGTEIKEYISKYKEGYTGTYLDCKGGNTIPSALFTDTVDDGRTRGYNLLTVIKDDLFDLKGYFCEYTLLDMFLDFGLEPPELDEGIKDISPIEVLDSDCTGYSDANFANKYYVDENDSSVIKEAYESATKNGDKVVLFRFASTDYFSKSVGGTSVSGVNGGGYIAKETMFFDFDIISLTFSKSGQDFVIPVVATPIDVIGGLEKPAERNFYNIFKNTGNLIDSRWDDLWDKIRDFFNDLWERIKGALGIGSFDWDKLKEIPRTIGIVLACVLGVVVLIMILPPIFKGIASLINVTKSSIELKTAKKEAKAQSGNNSKKRRVRNRSNNKK